jgi:YVTN family beta-propeller protein
MNVRTAARTVSTLAGFSLLLAITSARPQPAAHASRTARPPRPRARRACVAVSSGDARARRNALHTRSAFVTSVETCMPYMHEGMRAALAGSSQSADSTFVAAMIAHHEGAIDMARQILVYGKDSAIRSFALGVIAEQQAEVTMLDRWTAAGSLPRTDKPRRREALLGDGWGATHATDRVYTADQVSNTVSVIDPSTNRFLGQLHLGSMRLSPLPSPAFGLGALYSGEMNVHGLGFSPDHRLLDVVSTLTNAVTLVETATNRVKGTVYVGRNPHEGFFTPDGSALWVSIRGENYVSVIDPIHLREVRRIVTAPGPSMIVFRPDGRVAFVNHSFTPELDVVDVASGRVLARVPVVSPFSPDLVVTQDGAQVWMTHKDVGKVTVVNAQTYAVEGVIDTGPITNHVTMAGPGGGTRVGGASAGEFAYVTVCTENAVKVYRRDRTLVTTIATGACPHGIWASDDGERVYVGLQQGDGVDVIDTRTNTVIAEIPMGQSPQALVYVPNAVPSGAGTANLAPSATLGRPTEIELRSPTEQAGAWGRAYVRALGPIDGIDVSVRGLAPATTYTLYLSDADGALSDSSLPLATVLTDAHGAAPLVEAVTAAPLPLDVAAAGRRLILVVGTSRDGPITLTANSTH